MKKIKIALGTANPHKLEEINAIVTGCNVEFVLVEGNFDPIENGANFEENSFIKAKEAAKIMGLPALADDTGLCVEALDGAPGLYSARYAPTQKEKIEKLLDELKNIEKSKRGAKFVCTMVLASPEGEKLHAETGEAEGFITENSRGSHGFGYDPIFYMSAFKKTMAELTSEEKNRHSHRAKALLPMVEWIQNHLG